MVALTFVAALLVSEAAAANFLYNGLAVTPQMGWVSPYLPYHTLPTPKAPPYHYVALGSHVSSIRS